MTSEEVLILRELLLGQSVAALGTLHRGEPAVSMVPFAWLPGSAAFIIHVSRLATHTADMLAQPAVGFMVMGAPDPAVTPLALPRASMRASATEIARDAADHEAARQAYVARLPDSEELFSFADFSLFRIEAFSARFVAGFGRAHSLRAEDLPGMLAGEA